MLDAIRVLRAERYEGWDGCVNDAREKVPLTRDYEGKSSIAERGMGSDNTRSDRDNKHQDGVSDLIHTSRGAV